MPVFTSIPEQLRGELRIIRVSGWAGLLVFSVVLVTCWQRSHALQWILQAGLLWYLVLQQIIARLDMNRAGPDAPLFHRLGWANRLTILRGWLVAATGGFLFQDWPPALLSWVPGILYLQAAIADRLDGYVARRSGQTSLLGRELDTVFDALGLAIAPLLAVWYGQIHWSYLLFSAAWYLFQWGIARRKQRGLPVYNLPPNILRRAWAGFQMGFIAVVLLPVYSPPVTVIAGLAFMLPVLIGFCIDWLIVSGRIDRGQAATAGLFKQLESIGHGVLQPALRIVITVCLLLTLQYPVSLSGLTMLVAAGMILAGVAGRIVALVLILLLGRYYQTDTFGLGASILVFACVWIMLLGTGHYSLWRRDEDWVNRYDGA
jgi:CDP-diacylglycerol--glycerol-3-phosphate 3-phosphatidyltransferase